MKPFSIAATTLAAACALSIAAPAAGLQKDKGQKSPAPRAISGSRQNAPDEITLDTDLVQLDVSVSDGTTRPVFDLPRERFSVFEDGVAQKVTFFTKEDLPTSIAFVIDTSGSMRSKLETVEDAAENLARSKKAKDEMAVVAFKNEAELEQELTYDPQEIRDALDNLIAGGDTALFDAIDVAGDYVQKEARNRRRALIVVTDGVEKSSFFKLDQIVDHLRKLDVRLYIVGFTQDLDETTSLFRHSEKKKAENLIKKLADDTGGRAFFPKDLSEVGPITEQIAQDLRTVYVLGYYPSNTKKDGSFRAVGVKVAGLDGKPDSKLQARTRTGYYAAKQ